MSEISALLGKTLTKITNGYGNKAGEDDDEIVFHCESGESYRMYHENDCCEHVSVEDICGDLEDLIGSPILVAEEASSSHEETAEEYEPLVKEEVMKGILLDDQIMQGEHDSATWTFYKLDTFKGGVVIRWCGTSSGYYSEDVSFEEIH